LLGKWATHKKYGPQFAIRSWEPWAETTEDVERFLYTCIEGFTNRSLAQTLIKMYGLDVFKVLTEASANVLDEIPQGYSQEATQGAVLGWGQALATRDLSGILKTGGLSGLEIQAAMGRFGMEAPLVIRDNPFRLMEIPGFSFLKVDRLAKALGVKPADPKRIEGAILWAFQESLSQGHLFLPLKGIPDTVVGLMRNNSLIALPNNSKGAYARAIRNLADRNALILRKGVGVYLPDFHKYEHQSAAVLAQIMSPLSMEIDLESFIGSYERSNHITLSDAQREAVVKLSENRILVLTGLPGTGKCVEKNTLVSTSEGFKPIKSFLPADLSPEESRDIAVMVDTTYGPQSTAYVYNGGLSNTKRIRTKRGFTIEGTPEHPIRIIRDGEIIWAQLKDICIGTSVVLVRNSSSYSFGSSLKLPSFNRIHPLESVFRIPSKLTKALARLLGYLTSEGSVVSHKSWCVTAHDSVIRDKIVKDFKACFGVTCQIHRDKRVGDVGIRFNGRALIRWFRKLGVKPEYADGKTIPESILCAPRYIVRAYLLTLFEGDGSVDIVRKTIEYGTSSEILAYQLQTILLAFGVVATRTECVRGGKPYFRLELYGEDYDTFRTNLGFHVTLIPPRTCFSNTNKHLIYECSKLVRKLMDEVRPKRGKDYNRFYRYSIDWGKHPRVPSRAKLEQLLAYQQKPNSLTAKIRSLMDPGLFYDPIIEIQDGEADVVDFGVPESHEYISAGFISHNTTTVRALVRLFEEAGITFSLMAPTGIAAKRLAAIAGYPASTIHRALYYDGTTWGHHSDNKYLRGAVIIDEVSMVDQELLYRLLSALDHKTIVVFVGDDAQLPSVGPGNVLRELVDCKGIPNVRLTQIFRQSEKGEIVANSHRINRGDMPELLDPKEPTEFKFVPLGSEDSMVTLVVKMAAKLKSRDDNFQVLSPKYGGTVGVDNLNIRLRDCLNPSGPKEWIGGEQHFRLGDRLMVIKNDYKRHVYNGDMGKLIWIGKTDLVVRIHGVDGGLDMEVEFDHEAAEEKLKLAYAVTVHKCVDPDILVETPVGFVRAGDLSVEGEVSTPLGHASYRNLVRNPVGPMCEIETTDGYCLRVTLDHGVDVWDSLQGYIRKEAQRIQEGDFLRLRLGAEFEEAPVVSLPLFPNINPRASTYRIPTEVNEDVAEFLGMMVADGTVYSRGFRLAKRHLDVADQFAGFCQGLFKAEPKRFFKNNAYHVEVNSTHLSAWLRSIGGLDPNEKRVPSCVLASSLKVQARFLKGLFEDGTVNLKGTDALDHIELVSVSDDVIRRVRVMLLRLGIITGTTSNRSAIYIYGVNAKRFGEKVGFISSFKSERLSFSVGKETRYLVPILRSEIEEVLSVNGGRTFLTFSDKNVFARGTMSRHQLFDFLSRVRERTGTWGVLQERLKFHHSRVRTIRYYVGESVCIEVPSCHQFVQDGFCAWNSQGSEFDNIIMPIVRTQGRMLQRNLLYTAVTRAKKRVWLIGEKAAIQKAVRNNQVVQRNTAFSKFISECLAGVRGGHDS
jgi:ATP-dependent exoDNAse (exonuclease V) alpha subunit/intein/homing endonuclease